MANLLIGINLFDVWQAALMGIGVAVVGRVPLRRALWAVFALWLMWVTSSATMATISYRMPLQGPPAAAETPPE